MVKVETARKFTFDVGWVFVSLIVTLAVGFALRIIIGNYFDASGLGAYAMVLTIWTIVTLTAGIGIPEAIIKYVSEFKDKKNVTNSLVSAAMVCGLILGCVASLILFIISPYLESIFNIPNLGYLLKIVSFSFPFIIVNNVFIGLLNAHRMMSHYAAFEIFRKGIVLLFTLIFFWLGHGVAGAVMALVVSPVAVTILVLAYHHKVFKFRLNHFKKCTKRLTRFGSKIYFANAVGMINSQAAILLIGFYLTDTDVGIYAIVLMFFNLLVMLPRAMQRVTFPAISTYFAQKRISSIKKMMEVTMRFSFVLISIISLILIFYIDDVITLIFPEKDSFLLAVMPLRILAVMGLLYGTMVPVGSVFAAVGKPEIPLKMTLIQAGVSIGTALLLIPTTLNILGMNIGGINGAAISLGISVMVLVLLFFIFIRTKLRIYLKIGFIATGFLLFIGTIGIAYLLMSQLGMDGNITGVILIPVYTACLYYLGIVGKDDFEKFKNIINP